MHAVKYYAQAARVASKYVYEGVDSLALNQHMTTLAKLILEDILNESSVDAGGEETKSSPRKWKDIQNQVAVGTWLFAFFDSLLFWEEKSTSLGCGNSGRSFVEILSPGGHPLGMAKVMGTFDAATRQLVLETIERENTMLDSKEKNISSKECLSASTLWQGPIRSARLKQGSLLRKALLLKPKIKLGEMELTIPTGGVSEEEADGNGRRSKRRRRG